MDVFAGDDKVVKEMTLLTEQVKKLLDAGGTKGKSVSKIRGLARYLLKENNSAYDVDTLSADLINLYDRMAEMSAKTGKFTEAQMNELTERANAIGSRVVANIRKNTKLTEDAKECPDY